VGIEPLSVTSETGEAGPSREPVTILRGARVEVDGRRVGGAVCVLCLVALAVSVAVLFTAGVRKNTQITQLREHGVPVEVTVTVCLGLMGGSGSNLAGYECRGTLTIGGRRYTYAIPGTTFHRPGSALRAVTVPGDPALLSTTGALATEHASWRVFTVPAILFLILLLFAATFVLRRRRTFPLRRRSRSALLVPGPR
jgi:hypothetical protein